MRKRKRERERKYLVVSTGQGSNVHVTSNRLASRLVQANAVDTRVGGDKGH